MAGYSRPVVEMMVKSKSSKLSLCVSAIAMSAIVAGCTGTSTYGTGKSQEEQLFEDLTSIAMLGSKEKKKRIDYISRPTLVKPQTADLPSPLDENSSESAYFPKDPETKRAELLKRLEEAEKNGEELPEEILALRKASISRKGNRGVVYARGEVVEKYDPGLVKRQREEFLKKKAERDGVRGAAPRRWLTEPPSKYRTPEQTAAVGEVGEKEQDPYKAKKEKKFNIFDVFE